MNEMKIKKWITRHIMWSFDLQIVNALVSDIVAFIRTPQVERAYTECSK
jgi:hypothetical protein